MKKRKMISKKELTVFVVDDDPIYRALYKQYLLNMGFEKIKMIANGQECINRLIENPDIILLDHQMTPIDGLETLKKIKHFNPKIYLVYLSGQTSMKVTTDALKYGAFDYIIKSNKLEEEQIAVVIKKILNVKELIASQPKGTSKKPLNLFV
ncbi:MAG: response regulator [Taibaiella sp.]|nr:response regulator [Taibaiella sp.]